MNFITCKLYINKVDQRKTETQRQEPEGRKKTISQVDKCRKSGKTTVGQGRPVRVEWGCLLGISPRVRSYSADQPGVYTSDNTSYFVKNYLKWGQTKPIHPPVGHVPLESPDEFCLLFHTLNRNVIPLHPTSTFWTLKLNPWNPIQITLMPPYFKKHQEDINYLSSSSHSH